MNSAVVIFFVKKEQRMDDVKALSTIIDVLKQLEPEVQERIIHSVQLFLGIGSTRQQAHASMPSRESSSSSQTGATPSFSKDRTLSPKEFVRDKNPKTDVERVACLAFYLTHFREKPHFKTIDISALNTEAAQPKFSNASVAVDNARASGYLVPATKGNKQISAIGEKFVELLPDREAAREAAQAIRRRRPLKKSRAT
jgi:hypothetical protein